MPKYVKHSASASLHGKFQSVPSAAGSGFSLTTSGQGTSPDVSNASDIYQ